MREVDSKIIITADQIKFNDWFKDKVSATAYEIVLNPALDYAAESFGWRMTGVDGKPFARKTRAMTYEMTSDNTPAMRSSVWNTERFVGNKSCDRCELKVEKLAFEPPPESEFTLAGSGFANLTTTGGYWPNALVIVAAAVAFFSLFGIIALRKRAAQGQ